MKHADDGSGRGREQNTIHRVWQDQGIKPQLTKSFKFPRDPKFLEKLTDVVGFCLTPPQNAVVLCVNEKSQIQALDRTQPGLPLKSGRCGTFTHDYVRHGTTTSFAALQVVDGRVIGQCYQRHAIRSSSNSCANATPSFPAPRPCT